MIKKCINYLLFVLVGVFIINCEKGVENTAPVPTRVAVVQPTMESVAHLPSHVGIFIDSRVEGFSYECGDYASQTNYNGEFDYNPGDICTFMLGANKFDVDMGYAYDGIVTPFHFAFNENEAYGIAKIIQSLAYSVTNTIITLDVDKVSKLQRINFRSDRAINENIQLLGGKNTDLLSVKNHLNISFDLNILNKRKSLRQVVKNELLSMIKEKNIQRAEMQSSL